MQNSIIKLVRPNILAMKPYKSLRDSLSIDAPVFLDVNENPYGKFNRYPDSKHTKLRSKLAELRNLNPENIAVSNGSDEMIDLLIKIFCRPKEDKILVIKPSFAMYSFYASINENEVVPLNLDENFQIDEQEFLDKIKEENIKILFLCSPNNPTANTFENLEFYIRNFTGIVVLDEAYVDFSSKGSMQSLLAKYDRLVILQTLSKAWGLAALRIGIALANEAIIDLIYTIKSPFNISQINLESALLELSNADIYKKNLNNILVEKERLQKELKDVSVIEKIFPSEANFFLIKFWDAAMVYQKLLDKRILTSKRFPEIPSALRINVGTPEENNLLITTLKTIDQ